MASTTDNVLPCLSLVARLIHEKLRIDRFGSRKLCTISNVRYEMHDIVSYGIPRLLLQRTHIFILHMVANLYEHSF